LVLSQRSLRFSLPALLLALFVLLSGCATDTGTRRAPEPAADTQAGRLAATGDFRGAAEHYLRLAQGAHGDRATNYTIQASHLFALAGQPDRAQQVYTRINPAKLSSAMRVAYTILGAHLDLLRGQPQQALTTVNGLRSVPSASAPWIWLVRAEASQALGDALGSLRARVEYDRYLMAGTRREANQDAIWRVLQGLTDPQLLELQSPANSAAVAGWASLMSAYRAAPSDAAGLKQALHAWQAQHAAHPAAKGFVQRLAERSGKLILRPRKVAILLPAAGRYAAPAAAVQDGILAAWYAEPTGSRPEIQVYAVPEAATQVTALYQSALDDGAELVIGPLRKEAVSTLAYSGRVRIPTLALNRIAPRKAPIAVAAPPAPPAGANPAPGQPPAPVTAPQPVARQQTLPPDLYQFGLAPEDEAAAAARQAAKDGLHQAVVLVPVGAKGDRIAAAFTKGMEENGGVVLETQRYNTAHESAFSNPIKRLLNLDSSSARRKRLENLLGENLEFEPSRRSDMDFIFLYARPVNARQIIPQLIFFGAQGVPIYTTAEAFDGRPNRDLQGLVFPTMPWQSAPDGQLSRDRQLLQEYRSDTFAPLDRLYALGIDAYRVMTQLPRLRNFSQETVPGATGLLSVDPAGVVHRDPLWARVNHGRVDVYTAPVADPLSAGLEPGATDGSNPGEASATPLAAPEPIDGVDLPIDDGLDSALPSLPDDTEGFAPVEDADGGQGNGPTQ